MHSTIEKKEKNRPSKELLLNLKPGDHLTDANLVPRVLKRGRIQQLFSRSQSREGCTVRSHNSAHGRAMTMRTRIFCASRRSFVFNSSKQFQPQVSQLSLSCNSWIKLSGLCFSLFVYSSDECIFYNVFL